MEHSETLLSKSGAEAPDNALGAFQGEAHVHRRMKCNGVGWWPRAQAELARLSAG